MSEFDDDTAVTDDGPGRYAATLSPRWNVGLVPNGGYVMAIAATAAMRALGGREPLTMTGHYLSPTAPGPAALAVETIKEGRQLSTAAVALSQDGRERARFLVTCGTLDAPGPTHVDAAPPPLPPVEQAYKPPPDAPLTEVARRFDQRFDPTAMAWATRAPKAGPVELRAWVRFADGRDADARSLLLFADALPPPSLAILPPGWVPTVELTVHVRARPAPGWLRARFRTRFVQGGYLEEDGELWDETGRLVALSRQLAATPRGPSPLQPPVTP